jgi:hypothetical protein
MQSVDYMEVTAVVLYGGALAQYEVRVQDRGECYAELTNYKGSPSRTPPQTINLKKEGRHWVSTDADRGLSDEIGYAVELKMKPILEMRKRDAGHPAA